MPTTLAIAATVVMTCSICPCTTIAVAMAQVAFARQRAWCNLGYAMNRLVGVTAVLACMVAASSCSGGARAAASP